MRVERILKAINAKKEKYYSDTDTLLVQEDPADFSHLKEGGLHRKVWRLSETALSPHTSESMSTTGTN
jgi:hypothetical protein